MEPILMTAKNVFSSSSCCYMNRRSKYGTVEEKNEQYADSFIQRSAVANMNPNW